MNQDRVSLNEHIEHCIRIGYTEDRPYIQLLCRVFGKAKILELFKEAREKIKKERESHVTRILA